MRPAGAPQHRRPDPRLLVVRADGSIHEARRTALADHLRPGDLVVANDAATIPASLSGAHLATGQPVEVRLAGRGSLALNAVRQFTAVVFGAGDHRTPTEERPLPPTLRPGDALRLGPLEGTVARTLGHPRLIALRFTGTPDAIWEGIANHGRPIQYAHVGDPLALWDVWTRVAALPVAFEPPSAGFALDWALLARLRERGIGFATITSAAGISSTGDAALDQRLPLDESYRVPASTGLEVARARARGGRVVAVGTSVVRALEHARTAAGLVRSGVGTATRRIGPETPIGIIDAVLTGVHEPGESHYELLRALAPDDVLARALESAETGRYRTHEFGDSMLIERIREGELLRPARAYQPAQPGTTFRGVAEPQTCPPTQLSARSSDG